MAPRVYLPEEVTVTAVTALSAHLKLGLDGFAAEAGLDIKKTPSGRVRIRAMDPQPLIEVLPLQDDEGAFLANARAVIADDGLPTDLNLGEGVNKALKKSGTSFDALGGWQRIELCWLAAHDPLEEAQKFATARPEVRLFRVRATRRLQMRLAFWRMVDQLMEGLDPALIRPSEGPADNGLVNGLLEAVPGSLVCQPLLARTQPFGALLTTSRGTQVVAVLTKGMFSRPLRLGEWPTGFGGPTLTVADRKIYASKVKTFPEGFSQGFLYQCAAGANGLLEFLTDPGNWTSADEAVDTSRRWVTWASTRWDFAAIDALADSWGGGENVWTAFRALTILAELWQVGLHQLLRPNRLRTAAERLPEPLATWSDDIITNYEAELLRAFPGSPADAAWKFAEVRNLVHGVRRDKADPYARLHILRDIAREQPGLHVVADLAVLWWSALLLDPHGFSPSGPAPWVVSH